MKMPPKINKKVSKRKVHKKPQDRLDKKVVKNDMENFSYCIADIDEVMKTSLSTNSLSTVLPNKELFVILLLDSGSSSNMARLHWWNDYFSNLTPNMKKMVLVQPSNNKRFRFKGGEVLHKSGNFPRKTFKQEHHVHKSYRRQHDPHVVVKNRHNKRRSYATPERGRSLDLQHLGGTETDQGKTLRSLHSATARKNKTNNDNQTTTLKSNTQKILREQDILLKSRSRGTQDAPDDSKPRKIPKDEGPTPKKLKKPKAPAEEERPNEEEKPDEKERYEKLEEVQN